MSAAPYAEFNVAKHVGDSEAAVLSNRKKLQKNCAGLEGIQWLSQVHGAEVLRLDGAMAENPLEADASYSRQAGVACAVMTADCLPVLFCDRSGTQIAAAHAGWRGLAAGVLENTIRQFEGDRGQILAWFGPAIGPQHFEVGAEVREIFLAAAAEQSEAVEQAFASNPYRPGYYFANLYQLARLRLQRLGVDAIYGGDFCTYSDASRFFSYRRDGVTGRMVSLIYKRR